MLHIIYVITFKLWNEFYCGPIVVQEVFKQSAVKDRLVYIKTASNYTMFKTFFKKYFERCLPTKL